MADVSSSEPTDGSSHGRIGQFWQRYCEVAGRDAGSVPDAWAFGDSSELADSLLELVVNGPKRATAGAVAEYERDGDPIPRVGDHSILLDGEGRPRAVIETTDVRIGPLSSVDDQFAWDEGEGDRSRSYWLDAHTRYFTRRFAHLGLEFDEDIPVVFERFALRFDES